MPQKIALIGLGVMGQRMVGNMHDHDAFIAQSAWDPVDAACRLVRDTYPEITIGTSADEIINSPETDAVYIACPPLWHSDYVDLAVEAGKPIFCEKPLGVDVAESRAMVEKVEASGLVNAVNFPFGKAVAVDLIRSEFAADALGEIQGIDARFHFSTWPRDWQMDAEEWLSRRVQGGFTREVFSHYVFLIERLFGPASLVSGNVRYPDGPDGEMSESHLLAQLDCSGTPISVAGSVGGVGPDLVEFIIWGSRRSYRLHNWYHLQSSDGGEWQEANTHIDDPRKESHRRMLENFIALLEVRENTMPTFREALSVQVLVENILKGDS
jgi:predicted dehydrogenase